MYSEQNCFKRNFFPRWKKHSALLITVLFKMLFSFTIPSFSSKIPATPAWILFLSLLAQRDTVHPHGIDNWCGFLEQTQLIMLKIPPIDYLLLKHSVT